MCIFVENNLKQSKMKKGNVLVAIDPCVLDSGKNALIVGNEYPIIESDKTDICIQDDLGYFRWFNRKTFRKYFGISKCDDFQSLFSFMHQEHGLTLTNGQMWDIVNAVEKVQTKLKQS